MELGHRFRVVAWWASGRTGIAQSSSGPNAIHFASPPAFGGLEGRWTPEDLLLGAIASCYTTTFRTLADYSKFEYTDLQVEAEGVIRKAETGYSLGENGGALESNAATRSGARTGPQALTQGQRSVLGVARSGSPAGIRASD